MQIKSTFEIIEEYAKLTNKYCMYISFNPFTLNSEIQNAAPYISDADSILSRGSGILLFDTEQEMNNYYDLTVGQNGPTNINKYNGGASVSATTFSNEGTLLKTNKRI